MDHRGFFDVRGRVFQLNLLLESADMKFKKWAEPSRANKQTPQLCLEVNIKVQFSVDLLARLPKSSLKSSSIGLRQLNYDKNLGRGQGKKSRLPCKQMEGVWEGF